MKIIKINENNKKKIKCISGKLKKDLYIDFEIFFSDIETVYILNENKYYHNPVFITLVKKNFEKSFKSINDYMNYILNNKKNCIIYFHNFGKFDSTFILNWIINQKNINLDDVQIIERNNIIYQLFIKNKKIYFRDSFLLIPISLKEIGETFCDKFKKDNFNYNQINEIYKNNPDKLKDLCINDCKVLEEGFNNFNKIIKEKFKISITRQLTLPSLAFNIFKKKYYDENFTMITKNPYKEDQFIRKSYKGGISEVYIPVLINGFCYDANSLYPTIMKNNKFPVGKGKFVKGNEIDINNFIGFIECRIEVEKEYNFLTYRDPIKGLITPVGIWTDIYFHAEVKKALELGYKITFLKGFKYEKEEFIFNDYVTDLYEMRKNSNNKSINKISKLLLNSLYGRFGMKIFIESTKLINENQLNELKQKYEIRNIVYLGNNIYTVTGIKRCKNEKELYANSIDTEAAVQIASAITSYSRIFMYKFKNLENNKCYYSDTDSIFVKNELNKKFLGNELGQFKLEYKVKKGYFIAPKVYYIEKDNEKEKFIIKGMKKDELNEEKIKKSFNEILMGRNDDLEIKRINNFKRDLINMNTYRDENNIIFKFPFNKRVKIYNNKNEWVDTRAIKIKK